MRLCPSSVLPDAFGAVDPAAASAAPISLSHSSRSGGYGMVLLNTAGALRRMNRLDPATATYRQAIDVLQHAHGRGHPRTVAAWTELAVTRSLAKDLPGARAALADGEREAEGKLAPSQQERINLTAARAWILWDHGQSAEAEPLFRELLAAQMAKDQGAGRRIADLQGGLGLTLLALKRYVEAEPMLKANHDTWLALLGPQHEDVRKARGRMVELYQAWGRPEAARAYLDAPTSAAASGPTAASGAAK